MLKNSMTSQRQRQLLNHGITDAQSPALGDEAAGSDALALNKAAVPDFKADFFCTDPLIDLAAVPFQCAPL